MADRNGGHDRKITGRALGQGKAPTVPRTDTQSRQWPESLASFFLVQIRPIIVRFLPGALHQYLLFKPEKFHNLR